MSRLVSLDPRISRLGIPAEIDLNSDKSLSDQLSTFEVFHQKKEGAVYQHVGPVHANTPDLAFLFAKEQYSRRFTCTGIWVVPTSSISVTPNAEPGVNIYSILNFDHKFEEGAPVLFTVFHQKKRGAHHECMGEVTASTSDEALYHASLKYGESGPVVNVWIIPSEKITKSSAKDVEFWNTLSEKKYRDASVWRVMDKITKFKEEQKSGN